MRHQGRRGILAPMVRSLPIVLLGVAWVAACGTSAPEAPGAAPLSAAPAIPAAPETPDAIYSPFVVRVENAPFAEISFKDVGMSLPEEERALVYESLAEGLSLELSALQSTVDHEPAIADPARHLACESEHIYVDLWREGQGWGYSLWSGCGEDDKFGQHRVVAEGEGLASLDPLTDHIASRLRDAVRTGCFTAHC